MIINSSGGGAGLNFKVMGGTAQPTGRENLIWVNTSTEISGYIFSAEQPTSPTEGTVWIQTGAASLAAFNADKKNTVMLYPLGCKQYVSGAWVLKAGKIYINNTWMAVDPTLRIMFKGLYDNNITDGWVNGNKRFASGDITQLTAKHSTSGTSLSFSLVGNNAYIFNGCVISKNDIDFTNMKLISFKGTANGVQNQKVALSVMNRDGTYTASNAVARVVAVNSADTKNFAVTLDVSKITGSYALVIGLQVQNWNTLTVNVSELVIE